MNRTRFEERVDRVEQALGLKGEFRLLFPPREYNHGWTEAQQRAWIADQGVKESDDCRIVVFE